MAGIPIADTFRPNNKEGVGKGTFPVVKADDVWFNDGESLEEKGAGGAESTIQVETFPEASETYVDTIYQYIGDTTDKYTNGLFYQCQIVDDGSGGIAYAWMPKTVQDSIKISQKENNAIENKPDGIYVAPVQIETLPTASVDELGKVYQYVGTTDINYHKGNFYECISDGEATPTYSWKELSGGSITIKDVDELPSSEIENIIYRLQDTTSTYHAGDYANQQTEQLAKYDDIPDVSKKPNIFTGTQAEWDDLTIEEKEDYEIVNITDDTTDDGGGEAYIDYYSTSETKTNKVWIDGKPIYRKVLVRTTDASGTGELTMGTIDNFAQLVNITTITDSNSGTNQEIEFYRYRDSRLSISNGTATVLMNRIVTYNIYKVIMIVEYTKTTD